MSFWNEFKKISGQIVSPLAVAAGTLIGGPAGAAIGAQVGGLATGILGGSSTSTPQISVSAPPMTPPFIPASSVGSGGVTMGRNGEISFPSGLKTDTNPYSVTGRENGKIFGNPPADNHSNSGSYIAPVLFSFGAFLLLSD